MNLTLLKEETSASLGVTSFVFSVPDQVDIDHVSVMVWTDQTTYGISYKDGSSFMPTKKTFEQGGIELPECKDEDGARKVAEAVIQLSNMGSGNPFGEVIDDDQDKDKA